MAKTKNVKGLKDLSKLNKGDIIFVDWRDTNTPYERGWMTEEEHSKWTVGGGEMVRSVGIFVSQNDNYINIVGDSDMFFSKKALFLRPISVGKELIVALFVLVKNPLKE